MMPPKIIMGIRTDWVSNVLKVTQTDDKKKKKKGCRKWHAWREGSSKKLEILTKHKRRMIGYPQESFPQS